MRAASGIQRRLLRLAVPIVLANLTVPLAGLVDAAILGHLDEIRHLAGVALASVLFDYLYWTFGFLRMSTTGLTAQAVGRGDAPEALAVLARALVLAGAAAGAILLLAPALEALGFAVLSGGAAVEDSGRAYFRTRVLGAPAALANFAFVGWLIGRERGGQALAMTAVGNATNVALDYVLVWRLGMASAGAGRATAASQYAMLAVAVGLVARERPALTGLRGRVLERRALAGLLQLNRDILIRTLCLVSGFAGFLNLSALHGSVVLAANALLLKLLDVASWGIDGLAFAAESLAGQLAGRGDRAGLWRLLGAALAWGEAAALALLAVLVLGGDAVYGLLTSHADVVARVRSFEAWFALTVVFGAAAYVYDGLFLGLTEGGLLRDAMLVATFAGFVPAAALAWWLASPHALWGAFALFMAARVATLAARQRRAISAG